jgi:predicted AlkP superfamily phosphohydrolase/phosphomutase
MKTLILGLDAFDPIFFENLYEQGKLPHLGKLLDNKGYARFQVSNPPQSEVSWTSIATGLDPGGHGMFDFVHRDPQTYNLHVSLLPTGRVMGGVQFVRPSNARTIFDMAADKGYPATSLWWPATFPARPESPVRTLPGLGAPDIQGRLGVGTLYTTNSDLPDKQGKTPVRRMKSLGGSRFSAAFEGPLTKNGNALAEFQLAVKDNTADLNLGKEKIKLSLGKWSPIIDVSFKMGLLVSVHAITRLVLTQVRPHVQLYAIPLQIHPLHSPWRYASPASFVKEAWKVAGPFLTLGWPQDTTGLDDGCMGDEQFLDLCESIDEARTRLLMHQIDNFHEGVLASVFDSLDRIQHMFWRDRPDIIEQWYIRLDTLVGQVMDKLAAQAGTPTRLLVVSDHGFKNFDYKVHLNRWLIEQGFLQPATDAPSNDLKGVDWSHSQAYALGLNSLYLNMAGREGRGIVTPDQRPGLADQITQRLLDWKGPDGNPVVRRVLSGKEVFTGGLAAYGPDFLVGFSSGYRASADTGLGAWKNETLEPNHDHWGADHCYDPECVPGILFSSHDLPNYANPSFRDIPALSIDAAPDTRDAAPPPTLSAEDQEKVEERLRSLGYL